MYFNTTTNNVYIYVFIRYMTTTTVQAQYMKFGI